VKSRERGSSATCVGLWWLTAVRNAVEAVEARRLSPSIAALIDQREAPRAS